MDLWGAPLYGDPCRGCGFTWAAGQVAALSLVRRLPDSIDELVIGATGKERLPDLGWKCSGYIADMTDNTRIWAERLIAVARVRTRTSCPMTPICLLSPGTTTRWLSPERHGRFASRLRTGSAQSTRQMPLELSCCTLNEARWNSSMSSPQMRTTLSTTIGI